jgi:phosphoribosylformylglycinamidine (FGAM) synthase PurS component
MKYQIQTKLRPGIKDIEADAITKKLKQNGWSIDKLQVGQIFYVEYESPDKKDVSYLHELAKNILVNELLYDYEITEHNY